MNKEQLEKLIAEILGKESELTREKVMKATEAMVRETMGQSAEERSAEVKALHDKIAKLEEQRQYEGAKSAYDRCPSFWRKRVDVRKQYREDPKEGAGLLASRIARMQACAMARGIPLDTQAAEWGEDDVALLKWCRETAAAERATLKSAQVQDEGSLGFLVPEAPMGEFIELLRANQVVANLPGVTMLNLNGKALPINRQTGTATTQFSGEAEQQANSEATVDQIVLMPHKATTISAMTEELMFLADPSADAFFRDDMLQSHGLRWDLARLRGAGTQNEPKGIKLQLASANSFSEAATALTGYVSEAYKHIRLLADANFDLSTGAWIMRERTKIGYAQQLDSNGNFVFQEMIQRGELFGYPIFTTSQIPANLGSGDDTEVYFGAGSEIIIAESWSPRVQVFPGGAYYDGSSVRSGVSRGEIVYRLTSAGDIALKRQGGWTLRDTVDFDA